MLLTTAVVYAQQPAQQSEPGLLNLDTVFSFSPKSLDAVEWQPDGSGYRLVVRVQAADWAKLAQQAAN